MGDDREYEDDDIQEIRKLARMKYSQESTADLKEMLMEMGSEALLIGVELASREADENDINLEGSHGTFFSASAAYIFEYLLESFTDGTKHKTRFLLKSSIQLFASNKNSEIPDSLSEKAEELMEEIEDVE